MQRFWRFTPETFRVNILTERWPSGLRRTPAKRVYPKRVPRVQIPLSPPLSGRAPVAQLDRAPDYGSGGWGFKSLRARHENQQVTRFQSGLLSNCFHFLFPSALIRHSLRPLSLHSLLHARLVCRPLGDFHPGQGARRYPPLF